MFELHSVIKGHGGFSLKRPLFADSQQWKYFICTNKPYDVEIHFFGKQYIPHFLIWYYKKYYRIFTIKCGNAKIEWLIEKIKPNNGDVFVFQDGARYLCVRNEETNEITAHLIQTTK